MEIIQIIQKNPEQYTLYFFNQSLSSDLANWFVLLLNIELTLAIIGIALLIPYFIYKAVKRESTSLIVKVFLGLTFLPWSLNGFAMLSHHLLGWPVIH